MVLALSREDNRSTLPRVSPLRTHHRQLGLTLVEVALLISLFGVVLAVSVPTFLREVRTSKMAEAPHEIARIYASAAAYYAAPQSTAPGSTRGALPNGGAPPLGGDLHCLPEPAGPTPSKPSTAASILEFGATDTPGAATWRALGYEPSGPVRYRYSLVPVRAGCGAFGDDSHGEAVLSVRAEGDLDNDGVLSLFERRVTLQHGALALDPLLVIHDRVE